MADVDSDDPQIFMSKDWPIFVAGKLVLTYHKFLSRTMYLTGIWALSRRTALLLVLALSFCLQGCDFLYGLLDKKGAEEKKIVGEIVPFEKNLTVEEVQTLLKLYGYNPGRVDGVMGVKTRDALERFQRENGLEETRMVDQKTWENLIVFKETNLIVEGELNTRLVQTILKEAGFDPGKIDGKAGLKTQAAILNFQKARGLKADGKVGYKTLSQLAQSLPAKSP